jgi:hypothetical protein
VPAAPDNAREASAISSIFFSAFLPRYRPSAASRLASVASGGLPFPLCGPPGRRIQSRRAAKHGKNLTNSKKTALSPSDVFFTWPYASLAPVLQPDWDANAAVFSGELPCTPGAH